MGECAAVNTERLINGLEALKIPYDQRAIERFIQFHDILDEYNQHMDLTAVLKEDERFDRHDLDSVAILAHGAIPQKARVIDVGTGAGFPGIPILILRPDLQMTLLDAQQKRCLFLEDALKRMELTATVVHARAEDAGQSAVHREQYDFALSRAVASAGVLAELMIPFLDIGGYAVAWKGPKGTEEQESARRAAFLLGGTFEKLIPVQIPEREDWQHMLLMTKKVKNTPRMYPRKAGTPAKKPLA